MESTPNRRVAARAIAIAIAVSVVCALAAGAAPALGAEAPRFARVAHVCPAPEPGEASCFALARVPASSREAGSPEVRALAAHPAAVKFGPSGGLTPELLEKAYGFSGKAGGEGQTVAVVDAFDDPNIEADLAEFSKNYGLPECTAAEGCFKKVGQTGSASELPAADTKGWSVEITLDVETAHAACPKCHILLVEAKNALMTNLGAAVKKAVALGATVVSNSYGGPEQFPLTAEERALFEHAGVVIAAATGDFGYDWWTGPLPDPETPDLPASLPGVVSVGGTTLSLNAEGKRAGETVWNGNGRENIGGFEGGVTGGGCSIFFEAPIWQRYTPGFAATGCGAKRLSADVSAVADPDETGLDIFDTYDCGGECEAFKGGKDWSTIGGTSLSTPLISALYALAGGAGGISYPSLTLYSHLGTSALFDVTEGGNGYCDNGGSACGVNNRFGEGLDCEGTTACNAAPGYDGPSGVGTPASLEAFKPVPEEEQKAQRRAEEVVAEEARRKAAEEAALKHVAEEAARKLAEETARREAEAAPKGSSGQGGTAGFKAESAAVPNATLHGTHLQAGRGGVVTVRIACPAGVSRCEGTVSLRTLSALIAAPGAKASIITLAGGRFSVAGGRTASVRLRLTARGRALLNRRGTLRVRVTVLAHDATGSSHTSHATATLRAFAHH